AWVARSLASEHAVQIRSLRTAVVAGLGTVTERALSLEDRLACSGVRGECRTGNDRSRKQGPSNRNANSHGSPPKNGRGILPMPRPEGRKGSEAPQEVQQVLLLSRRQRIEGVHRCIRLRVLIAAIAV